MSEGQFLVGLFVSELGAIATGSSRKLRFLVIPSLPLRVLTLKSPT